MKKILFALGALLLSTQLLAEGKFGYVNVEVLLSNSKSFTAKQEALEAKFMKIEAQLADQFADLKGLAAKYNEVKDDLSPEEKKLQVTKITTQEQALKEKATKAGQNFELAQAEILQEFQDKINAAIKKFATENNYQLIVYKDIAYAAESIDITDKISALIRE